MSYSSTVLARPDLDSFLELTDALGSTTALDSKTSATYAATGVVFGTPGLIPGESDTAATFAGTVSIITLDSASQFDFEYTDEFSVSDIIKPNFARTGTFEIHTIVSKIQSSGSFRGWMFEVEYDTSTSKALLKGWLINDFNTSRLEVRGTTDLLNDVVYNVSMYWNTGPGENSKLGDPSGIRLKVNGQWEPTTVITSTFFDSPGTIRNSVVPTIGARSDGAGLGFFSGVMEKLAVYAGPLFPSDSAVDATNAGFTIAAQPTFPSNAQQVFDDDLINDCGDNIALRYVALNFNPTSYIVTTDTDDTDSVSIASCETTYDGIPVTPNISKYSGTPSVTPIGGPASWVPTVIASFSHAQSGSTATEAISDTVTFLTAAASASVVYSAAGSLANAAKLLSGHAALEAKLACWIVMACNPNGLISGLTDNASYNLLLEPTSSTNFFANATATIFVFPDSEGYGVLTGTTMDPSSPAFMTLNLSGFATRGRESWDSYGPFLIRKGMNGTFYAHRGTMTVGGDSVGSFTPSPTGNVYLMEKTVPNATIAAAIEADLNGPTGPTIASATTDGSNVTLVITGDVPPDTFSGGNTTVTGSLFASSGGGITIAGANATISGSNITCPLTVPVGEGQTLAIDSTNLHGLQDSTAAMVPSFSSLTITNSSTIIATTPAAFTLTPFSNGVVVSWTSDRDCNVNVATKIYRSTDNITFTLLHTLNNTTASAYNDTTAVNGTQYWYNATREYFDSGHVSSATSTLTTQPPAGVPVLTYITVVPSSVKLANMASQAFAPTGYDQFGNAIANLTFTSNITLGGGSFSNLTYTSDGNKALLSFSNGSVSGQARVNFPASSGSGSSSLLLLLLD